MPLDSHIYGIQRQPEQPDILRNFLQLSALKQSQQAQQFAQEDQQMQRQRNAQATQIGDIQIQQAQRQQKDQEILQSAYQQAGGDIDKVPLVFLKAGGSPATFQKLQEDSIKYKKELAALDHQGLEGRKLKNEQFLGLLGNAESLPDDAYAASWPEIKQKALAIDPNLQIPDQPVPKDRLGLLRMGFETEGQRLAKETERRLVAQAGETKRHNTAIETNSAEGHRLTAENAAATRELTKRGQDITVRGQNMTDARSRETNDLARSERALTKLSDTVQKEGIPELEQALGAVETTLGKYKEDIPGIGRVTGGLPAAVLTKEGKSVRQDVAAVKNIILNARSGAAVTDQELRRLVEELGTGIGMTADDLRSGLAKVRKRFDAIKQNVAAGVKPEIREEFENRGGVKLKQAGNQSADDLSTLSTDELLSRLK